MTEDDPNATQELPKPTVPKYEPKVEGTGTISTRITADNSTTGATFDAPPTREGVIDPNGDLVPGTEPLFRLTPEEYEAKLAVFQAQKTPAEVNADAIGELQARLEILNAQIEDLGRQLRTKRGAIRKGE